MMPIKKIIAAFLVLLPVMAMADTGRRLPVVPCPLETVFADGSFNAKGARVVASGLLSDEAALAGEFAERLKAASGSGRGRSVISFRHVDGMSPEEYSIDVSGRRIEVLSSSYSGTLYAIRTLMQMLPAGVYSGSYCADSCWNIPCVRINDRPRFGYRGLHLDCSRHFFGIDEIHRLLDLMSFYKLNRFHWHLTDDHGWRAEIRKYPLLTETGSYRDGTMVGRDMDSNDGVRYGGYYTQQQMKEVVDYAARLGIEVVPEIDLPAHIVSALAAYPHLGCTGGPYRLMTVWDISPEILCAGKDSTFEFIEDVLDEICEIFPYEYIHIGGDECPKDRWKACPFCQARIAELGLEDTEQWTAEHYLQNYVTARIQGYLQSKGRKIIGWDEILEGSLSEGATVMSWRGVDGGIKAASEGFDAIMTPCEYCYLDYCQYDRPELEPISIGHYVPVQKCYSYEPLDGIPEEYSGHILGVQCNLWTEFIATAWHLEYMLLPRMLAISEVQWSAPEVKCYDSFRSDLITHQFPILESMGYDFSRRVEEE
ncbi:MAG: beta-N-acetylhexosaminidase [Bacteroidales bacterium]|nr:beta-N-acetylhexosaminidase [Bacteroidales bacterium]